MPPKFNVPKPSKNPPMRKSTRKVLKTARSQHVEPELEGPAVHSLPADDDEDMYVNDEEEAAFLRREEEEESEEDEEEDADEEEQDDEEEANEEENDELPKNIQVVPQKRKMGKDTKRPTSKILCNVYSHHTFSK